MDKSLEILGYIGTFILGYISHLFIPSKRRNAEIYIVANLMSIIPKKQYMTYSTFHLKELEKPNQNSGGINTRGYIHELNREFHNLYFREIISKSDSNFVRIEINRKVSDP